MHILFSGVSNCNSRRYTPLPTQIVDVTCRDGSSLLIVNQPEYVNADDGAPVTTYLDDNAQVELLKHLKAKFEA